MFLSGLHHEVAYEVGKLTSRVNYLIEARYGHLHVSCKFYYSIRVFIHFSLTTFAILVFEHVAQTYFCLLVFSNVQPITYIPSVNTINLLSFTALFQCVFVLC